MTGVTLVMVPNIMGGGGRGESTGHRMPKGINMPCAIVPKKLMGKKAFTEELKGSKSKEQLLSTEITF
jgi:hypothetical protein